MKDPDQRDLFPGALEMMILRTLQREPLHGYALAQHSYQQSAISSQQGPTLVFLDSCSALFLLPSGFLTADS
jgi:hypothetical protein